MAFPVTLDSTLPPDSESPRAGALRIRNLTQAMIDLLGLTSGTPVNNPPFQITPGGLVTLSQGAAGALLTNKTGGTLLVGNVVSFDATNDQAAALSDFQGSLVQFAVALATVAPNAQGPFATQGVITALTVQGAVARGNYLRKSATTLAAEDTTIAEASATTPPAGAFAVALSNAAGPGAGTVIAYLLGSTQPQPTAGILNVQTGSIGTPANLLETTLFTYNLAAALLGTNGSGVRLKAWGTLAANGNTKTVRLYFGATVVVAFSTGANADHWIVDATIIRTGANTQNSSGESRHASSTADASLTGRVKTASPAEVTSAPITVKVTGINSVASANDIVANGFIVDTLV